MLSYTDPAVTVAEADAYAAARLWADWIGDEPAKAAALLRSQTYFASTYNARWATEWDNADAPERVKYAIIEGARRELVAAGSLNPDYDPAGTIKKERKKVGPLEKELEYAVPQSVYDARPVFGMIDSLLSGLLASTGAAMNFRVVRG